MLGDEFLGDALRHRGDGWVIGVGEDGYVVVDRIHQFLSVPLKRMGKRRLCFPR